MKNIFKKTKKHDQIMHADYLEDLRKSKEQEMKTQVQAILYNVNRSNFI